MNTDIPVCNPSSPTYIEDQDKFLSWCRSLPNTPIELTFQYGICDTGPYAYRYRLIDDPMRDDRGRPQIVVNVEVYDVLRDRLLDQFVTGCNKHDDETWSSAACYAIAEGPLMATVAEIQTVEMEKVFKETLFNVGKFLSETRGRLSDSETWEFLVTETCLGTFVQVCKQMKEVGIWDADIENLSFRTIREVIERQSKVWEDDDIEGAL